MGQLTIIHSDDREVKGVGVSMNLDVIHGEIGVFVCLALVAISLCAPQNPKDVTVLQYINDVRPDGYDLLFETSDGTLRQETGVLKNPGTDNEIWEVVGKYKWISPDGEEHIMDFVANEGGVGGPGLGIRGALVGK
uniref:Uncharacterized protein n=1 Tax=Timema genevievae TaxID=629358 RepID=A0A7R9PGP4_TIMGE|nr:unnamed protein product [Timema genevievae]